MSTKDTTAEASDEPQSTHPNDQSVPDRTELVLSDIEAFVEPEPDGKSGEASNVWTSQKRLESHAGKNSVDYDKSDVEIAVNDLIHTGKVIRWFGLLAPATDGHLLSIIKNEQLLETPRTVLIGECNSLRKSGDE